MVDLRTLESKGHGTDSHYDSQQTKIRTYLGDWLEECFNSRFNAARPLPYECKHRLRSS